MLVQHFGWQAALRVLGGVIILISFPLALSVKETPTQSKSAAMVEPAEATSVFKNISFYLLMLGSMASIVAVSGTQQNRKLFLSLDRHYTQSQAARVLSLVPAFSIVGRLLMEWLADRFSKKYVMLSIYALVAAAIPFLFFGQTQSAMYVFAAVFGIGLGGDYMIIPLMTAEIFGVKILGRLMGVILTAGGVAEAMSPWLVSRLRDMTGNYTQSCLVLIGMALLGAVAVLALPERRKSA